MELNNKRMKDILSDIQYISYQPKIEMSVGVILPVENKILPIVHLEIEIDKNTPTFLYFLSNNPPPLSLILDFSFFF